VVAEHEGLVAPDEDDLAGSVEADQDGGQLAAGGPQAVEEVVEVAGIVGQADQDLGVDLAQALESVGAGQGGRVEDGAVVRAEGPAAADRLVVEGLGRRAARGTGLPLAVGGREVDRRGQCSIL